MNRMGYGIVSLSIPAIIGVYWISQKLIDVIR